MGFGNENVIDSKTGGSFADFDEWKRKLIRFFATGVPLNQSSHSILPHHIVEQSSTNNDENVESSSEDEDLAKTTESKSEVASDNASGLVDLEELGNVMKKARTKIKADQEDRVNGILKEMVTPELRQALTKQGYKLIGSHSGVKLCRWTKVCGFILL